MFIKFVVQINERTKIDISLGTFETAEHKLMHNVRKQIQQTMKTGGKLPSGDQNKDRGHSPTGS